jgi:hypothetical protein
MMSSVFTARQNTNDPQELDLPEARCLKLAYSQLRDPSDVQPL